VRPATLPPIEASRFAIEQPLFSMQHPLPARETTLDSPPAPPSRR
jgi:hypothetical protein